MGGHGLPPQVQPVQHFLEIPVGEEVQHAVQPLAAGGHGAGEVEDGRAADAVLGEQHLAAVLCHRRTASPDGDAALGLDALQRTGVGGVGLQLDEGGVELRPVVSQTLGQLIAGTCPTQYGKLIGSFPLGLYFPNKVSAIALAPSVTGSHP